MTTDERWDQKLQNDINREVAKISLLSSGKMKNTNILQAKKYYLMIKIK